MRAEINMFGVIVVRPEDTTEAYALRAWCVRNTDAMDDNKCQDNMLPVEFNCIIPEDDGS